MSEQNPTSRTGDGDALDGSVAPSSLGASASIPAGPKGRRGRSGNGDGDGSRRTRRLPRLKVGPLKGGLLILVAVVLLALLPLVASSLKKTPRDKVGISYGGGPIEGTHYQRTVQPGSRLFFNGFFDPLYLYPADQQNYIVSKSVAEGDKVRSDAVVAPSQDRVQVSYQVAVYYKLNTDRLRSFHEEFGLKYQAFTDSGWRKLIQDTFRQQLENVLQDETRRHPVSDIYGDAEQLLAIQAAVQTGLSDRLEQAMGEQYFCAPTFRPGGECGDPTFVIKNVDIPESVVAAYEGVRTSDIAVAMKENEVRQREQEALGAAALREALGDFGPVYATLKAIESGKLTFWVLPGDTGITVPSDGATTPVTPGGDATGTDGGN